MLITRNHTSKIGRQGRNTRELEWIGEGHKSIGIVGTTLGCKDDFYWIRASRSASHSTDDLSGGRGLGCAIYSTNGNIVIGENCVKICSCDGDVTSSCG